MKHVLLVDDEERVLQGLRRQLRPLRKEWKVLTAVGGPAALAILEREPVDVVITDMRMPGMDGAELLAECKRRHPTVLRMVLSGQMEQDASLRSIAVAHQALSKPCDPELLRDLLGRAAELGEVLRNDTVRRTMGELDSLPILPDSYDALTRALDDDGVSIEDLVPVTQRDPMLTAKVLQIVNSAVVGARTHINDLGQALGMIGLENLRGLVLHYAVVQSMRFDRIPYGLDLEAIRSVATWTASLARRIAPAGARDSAFSSALLKDTGLILLALRRSEDYETVSHACEDGHRPRVEVEREVLGVTAGQVAAYLLGMWGLPQDLLLAVLHHREVTADHLENEPATRALHAATSIVEELLPSLPGQGTALQRDGAQLGRFDWGVPMNEWLDLGRSILEEEEVHA